MSNQIEKGWYQCNLCERIIEGEPRYSDDVGDLCDQCVLDGEQEERDE